MKTMTGPSCQDAPKPRARRCATFGGLFTLEASAQSVGSLIWNATCNDGSYHSPSTRRPPDGFIYSLPGYPRMAGHAALRLAETPDPRRAGARPPVTAADAFRTG